MEVYILIARSSFHDNTFYRINGTRLPDYHLRFQQVQLDPDTVLGLPTHNMAPFHEHGLTLTSPPWISNYIHYKMRDEITDPLPNFNNFVVEVWEWISNFIPHFTGHDVITYPCWENVCPCWYRSPIFLLCILPADGLTQQGLNRNAAVLIWRQIRTSYSYTTDIFVQIYIAQCCGCRDTFHCNCGEALKDKI